MEKRFTFEELFFHSSKTGLLSCSTMVPRSSDEMAIKRGVVSSHKVSS